MSPFSMALMSGLKRQSVGARTASMPGCSSLRDMAKLVKLYICRKRATPERVSSERKRAAFGRSVTGSASALPWWRAAAWSLSSTAECFPEPRTPSPGPRACRRRRRCPLRPQHPAKKKQRDKVLNVWTWLKKTKQNKSNVIDYVDDIIND